MKIKGLILDLDGVICDTANYHYTAWKRLAAEYGLNLTIEQNEELKGVSRLGSINKIVSWAGISITNEQLLLDMERKNDWYLELIKKMTVEESLPGVGLFFNKAKIMQFKIGLGSASKNANLVLSKLNLVSLFDCIVDANTVINGKPHPETFLKAAEGLGLSPFECVVFEDSISGVEAAIAANMPCIGIGLPQNLNAANLVIPNLGEFDFSVLETF